MRRGEPVIGIPQRGHQCHLSVSISAHLSCLSVLPISAIYEC
ncbi:unnamed protein product [Staurois parvus]|uniref:Uncharacterized protein n=1 Tax=Staurois parvus TaxID=386267 RepID=A0ABN9AS73_9NEOB|nr:unnamed protein product [Staurois parvus]